MDSFGERILYLRQSILKLTQKDFSEILGISQGSLSDIEHDNRGISVEALINLLIYSKSDNAVSLEWLLLGESKKSPQSDLTESEREILKLVQPLSDVDKIKVLGVIENYLGSRASAFSNVQPMYITEEQASKLFKETAKKTL